MGKEKKLKEVEQKDYFKELLSFFIIVIIIILLGNLGTLGYYGVLILKIIFGEWYFLILIYSLISRIKYLIKGKTLDFTSVVAQGLIMIYLALSLFSHLTIYTELGLTRSNVFSKTLSLYKDYFSTFDNNYYVGGGIIGLLIFQVCVLLLDKIGVMIVGVSFIILGLSYMMNHSVLDFFKKFKTLYNTLTRIKNFLISHLKKLSLNQRIDHQSKKKVKVNLSILQDVNESPNLLLQEEIAKEYEYKINNLIEQNNLNVSYLKHYVGYNSTSYVFKLSNGLDSRLDLLLKIFEYKAFYISYNDTLIIDALNQFKNLLTLKKLLMNYDFDKFPIGINNMNDYITLSLQDNGAYLICGDYQSGIKTFIKSFVSTIIFKYNNQFKLYMLDVKREFKELSFNSDYLIYKTTIEEINKILENLIFEYDKRQEVLKFLDKDNYLLANEEILNMNKQIEIINPYFVILNVRLDSLSNDASNKLEYLASLGKKVGIYIILIVRSKESINMLNLALYQKILFKLSDLSLSIKLSNSDIACMLSGKGDFLYLENKKISHGQSAYLSMSDFNKLINKITF